MAYTIVVFSGETEQQAHARDRTWLAEGRAVLGFESNGSFIFHGRKCISGPPSPPVKYLRHPDSVATATSKHRVKLERRRPALLRRRAAREASTPAELSLLLKKYGVSNG